MSTLKVIDILSAAEYVGCEIVDAAGNSLTKGKDAQAVEELYEKAVEHIEARDGEIIIFTFIHLADMIEGLETAKEPKGLSVTTENMYVGNCPNCNKFVTSKHHKVCSCGQRLKWGK